MLYAIIQAKAVSILQGGHIKLSHPSLRPKLYLSPGDKGYVSSTAACAGSGEREPLTEGERQVRSSRVKNMSLTLQIGVTISGFLCCRRI